MIGYRSKVKYIWAIILIVALSAFAFSVENFGTNFINQKSPPPDNVMIFSRADFICTFFFNKKVNTFKENYFAEHRRKLNLQTLDNIIHTQTYLTKKIIVNYKITVFPFYVMICVLFIRVVIKFIFNKDGKKRPQIIAL